MSEKLRIVAVALRTSGGLIMALEKPTRHPTLMLHAENFMLSPSDYTQGFLASNGMFCDREAAYRIAQAAGQLHSKARNGQRHLYSEDLW